MMDGGEEMDRRRRRGACRGMIRREGGAWKRLVELGMSGRKEERNWRKKDGGK